jgi:hypothetical protein
MKSPSCPNQRTSIFDPWRSSTSNFLFFLRSVALFCRPEKLIHSVFNPLRTLCGKHPGWGLYRSSRSFHLATGLRAALTPPEPALPACYLFYKQNTPLSTLFSAHASTSHQLKSKHFETKCFDTDANCHGVSPLDSALTKNTGVGKSTLKLLAWLYFFHSQSPLINERGAALNRWGAVGKLKTNGGTDMKHFSSEEWVDFVNEVTALDQKDAMQKHLATGCKRCTETVALWQSVSKTAAAEAGYQPPTDLVRAAKAAFVTSGLPSQRKQTSSAIELLFDSFMQPAFEGARSVVIGTRQMLYRAHPYQIDLQIEPKPESNVLVVIGQVLDISQSDIVHQNSHVALSDRRGVIVHTSTNQFGEFRAEIENTGDLELSFQGLGEDPVVITLTDVLRHLPRGRNDA